MTLCIAATCINNRTGEPAIVLCSDSMVVAGASSSETVFKRVDLGPYVALFSGQIAEAHELLSIYRDYLSVNPLLKPSSIAERLEQLRQPLRDHQQRKLDHLVRMRLGLDHAEFIKLGDQIDSQIRTSIVQDLWHATSVNVELLLVSIAKEGEGNNFFDRSFIFRLQQENIDAHKNFSCVGQGALAAEQALHRREQSDITFLDPTLYHVFEAKKMGEISPSVGKRTTLAVMETDSTNEIGWRIRVVSAEAKSYLGECFQRYGPQPVGHGAISFPGELFEY